MSLTASIITTGVNSHLTTAEEANALATDILNPGVIGTTGNTSGVSPATGGFSVNAQGSPDTTIAIAAGVCYVTATPTGGNSQKVRVKNSASANLTISANATGATRFDWIYVKIDPDKAVAPNVSATDVATLVSSRSTSATTDNGTPPTYGLLLAVVTVANGFSTITNGTIADKRTSPITGISSASSFFALNNFVESGCVWSGDAYASTLAASMTSGYVWISGVRLFVSAVTARTFTASKDTYVDLSDNGDGTAVINYDATTANNGASPALSAGRVRIAIIVAGASTIASAGSVNQGQSALVLPISGGFPYAINDSLGNKICPRDPSAKELGYSLDSTGATLTASFVTHTQVIAKSKGREVRITWGAQVANGNSGADRTFTMQILCDGATTGITPSTLNYDNPNITGITTNFAYGFTHMQTPSVGAHTWVIQYKASAGAAVVLTANFLRVEEVL